MMGILLKNPFYLYNITNIQCYVIVVTKMPSLKAEKTKQVLVSIA